MRLAKIFIYFDVYARKKIYSEETSLPHQQGDSPGITGNLNTDTNVDLSPLLRIRCLFVRPIKRRKNQTELHFRSLIS